MSVFRGSRDSFSWLADILDGLSSHIEAYPKLAKFYALGISIICFANYFLSVSTRGQLKDFDNIAFNTGVFWLVFSILLLVAENKKKRKRYIQISLL